MLTPHFSVEVTDRVRSSITIISACVRKLKEVRSLGTVVAFSHSTCWIEVFKPLCGPRSLWKSLVWTAKLCLLRDEIRVVDVRLPLRDCDEMVLFRPSGNTDQGV